MKVTITTNEGDVYDVFEVQELNRSTLANSTLVDSDGDASRLADVFEDAAKWCNEQEAARQRAAFDEATKKSLVDNAEAETHREGYLNCRKCGHAFTDDDGERCPSDGCLHR